MTTATFLGTGNFQAPGRYWNSFVLDRNVLVEPSPTALPHLRRCGLSVGDLDVVIISHFHPDHTFGWPFLLYEVVRLRSADRPFHVVGPPGVQEFLAQMMALGAVTSIATEAHRRLDLRYIEVDGTWQSAGELRFRAIEVEHVRHLRCFGYVVERGDRRVGYSGDVRPCAGLEELAGACDVLVLECNGPHPPPVTHMDGRAVEVLRRQFPAVPFVLTHLGAEVDATGLRDIFVPGDFETLTL